MHFKPVYLYQLILIITGAVLPCFSIGQYTGGSNDGFSHFTLAKTSITDAIAFRGFGQDGFSSILLEKTSITDVAAFRGGENDGFHSVTLNKTNITDIDAFKGGSNDGFQSITLSKTNITDAAAFSGGSNDGFQSITLSKMNITDVVAFRGGSNDGFQTVLLGKTFITDEVAFKGGIGRGENQGNLGSCIGGNVVWIGSQSSEWGNKTNWSCGNLPNSSSTVIISSGASHNPEVNINVEIYKLILQESAIITVRPGIIFKINGQ